MNFLIKLAATAVVSAVTTSVMNELSKKALENDKFGPALAHKLMQTRKLVEDQAAKYKPPVADAFNMFGKETAKQADKLIADLRERMAARRNGTPPDAA
jgi:hypothetical protein